MAITIRFDSAQLPEKPTFVLATRSGIKLGELFTAQDAVVHDNLTSASEISLTIYKELDGVTLPIWDDITALKLIWVKEWDKWFQIDIDTEQTTETVKHITGASLSEAELSQIYLYNIEINTEDDILNDDYTVTVLYDSTNPKGSLLDRLLSDKAPHYTITHVDSTIASIQRSFSFDGTTILDAFYEIAEEIGCIFIFDSGSNADGSIARTIKVYDLETACMNDNCDYYQSYSNRYRTDSMSVCPKCGSTNLHTGYGEDTTIFVSSDNLSDDVTKTPDTDSVKNCLKMVAGDDLMTSVIMSCNPAGTQYMWSIPQWMRSDMSQSLQDALQAYDELYDEYKYTKEFELTESVVEAYNALVADYQSYNSELSKIGNPIVGFSGLTEVLYDLIDFENYLQTSLMPDVSVVESTVEEQVSLIRDMVAEFSNTISLATISSGTSQATVESTLKLLVRAAMDTTRYSYEITTSAFSNTYKSDGTGSISWSGYVAVTSETENDDGDYDSAVTSTFTVTVNNDYQNYIEQLIYKTVSADDTEDLTVSGLFAKDLDDFATALRQYALDNLEIIADCCQGVLDVLLEYGAGESTSDYYTDLYYPYYQKLQAIETEMNTRSAEIAVIESVEDEVDTIRIEVSDALDFEGSLGEELWAELCAYRREDTYENSNYISDGLSNSELVSYALQFVERTEEELQKASTLQHTISTTLRNLLVIPEFSALVDYFSVGNWIRVEIDGEIYRLRLESYEIDYNDLTTIQVEFSDVEYAGSTNSDLGSLFSSMSAVASSYPYTAKQVSKNSELTGYVSNWVDDGLDITNTNLVNNNDNQYQVWDEHGFLLKKYNAILDDYEDTQMKLVNRGLYLTNDNWKTVKTAVGLYWYNNPTTGELTSTYGIMAETLVGKLVLGESLGIYNSGGGLSFDEDGLVITNGVNTFAVDPSSDQLFMLSNADGAILYVDSEGNLQITASSITSTISGEVESQVTKYTSTAVKTITTEFTTSSSQTEIDDDSKWSTDTPVQTDTKPYVWLRSVYTYGDGTIVNGEPVCITGADGVGINSVIEYYLATSSNDGVTTDTDGWTTDMADANAALSSERKYLWNYETMIYTNGSTLSTMPVIIGAYGDDGTGISGITEYYLASEDSVGITIDSDGWTGDPTEAVVTSTLKYLWNYEVVAYTNGTKDTTEPVIIGVYGDTGDTGIGISAYAVYYYVTTGTTDGGILTIQEPIDPSEDSSGWSITQPSVSDSEYLWVSYQITYTDGSVYWTSPTMLTDISTRNDYTLIKKNYNTVTSTLEEYSRILGETDKLVDEDGNVVSITEKFSLMEQTADALALKVSSQTDDLEAIEASLVLTIVTDDDGNPYGAISQNANYISLTGNKVTIESDNFTLAADGSIVAKNGKFYGYIEADSGFIGDFTIENGILYNSKSTFDSEGGGIYIGIDGIALGDNFSVTNAGVVSAYSGVVGPLTITNSTNTDAYTGHLYERSAMIQKYGIDVTVCDDTYEDDESGDEAFGTIDMPADIEFGIRDPGTTVTNTVLYLAVKNSGSEEYTWDTSNRVLQFSVTAAGRLKCSGIDIRPDVNLRNEETNRFYELDSNFRTAYTDNSYLILNRVKFGSFAVASDVDPDGEGTRDMGGSSYYWRRMYCDTIYRNSTASTTSDRKYKQNITELTDDYIEFFKRLVPVSFDYTYGDTHRTHLGYVAQDVRDEALATVGDLALFKASVIGDDRTDYEEGKYTDDQLKWGLAYEEFVPLLTKVVQDQQKQLEEQQEQIDAQQEQINTLLQYVSDNSTE